MKRNGGRAWSLFAVEICTVDCRNCSTNSSNTSTKGAKLMWGATKDCCSRSVRDVDDVAVGFPPSPRRFSRPPVNRKFVAPDSPLDRPPACRDGGQLTAAGRSTTGRVLGSGLRAIQGVRSRTSAGMPAWNSNGSSNVVAHKQPLGLRPWIANPKSNTVWPASEDTLVSRAYYGGFSWAAAG